MTHVNKQSYILPAIDSHSSSGKRRQRKLMEKGRNENDAKRLYELKADAAELSMHSLK